MHRIRTWARAKAHGDSRLVTSSRSASVPRTSTGLSSASRTTTRQGNGNLAAGKGSTPAEGGGDENEKAQPEKKPVVKRFFTVVWNVLTSSWINVLLVFVPVGIAVRCIGMSDGIIFAMNAIAIVPLAGLLAHATESVAKRLGDTVGALMNVTFGNAVELIIFIIALVKDEIRIVQASLLGSILSNLLLILGMSFLLGGLRFREQIYNSTVTQMSACLLSLSVISLLLPTAFHASFSSTTQADLQVLKVSRGTSVILLLVYFLYLLFQLNSHAYMYESTPQHVIDRESVPGPAADFFESSDSSDSDSSSSSDSDSSSQSYGTARRIKRAIRKGRRSRKQSMASAEAEKPTNMFSPEPSAVETSSDPLERTLSEPTASSSQEPATLKLTDEAVQALGDVDEGKKKKRKHKHRKQRKAEEHAEAAEAADTVPADFGGVDGNTKRVDFALAPDLEAQTGTARPKPFSLRTLRPNLAKNLTQNVFTSPPTAANPEALRQQPPRPLRRTQSLPSQQHQSYRGQPGALPPIVPIVVNSQPRTTDGEDDEEPDISRTSAILLLLGSTALVALCAEFMVDAIDGVVSGNSGLSEAFVGLILLPIVGNAAEHVTAVTVAIKNKMDLAIGVAIGSSIQIALFVTPLVVILGWIMNKDMSLYFTLFETISMFVSAFIVNFLVLDGRSNYLEGSLLCAAYVIIALAAFFYPDSDEANSIGGGSDDTASAKTETAKLMARGVMGMLGWH